MSEASEPTPARRDRTLTWAPLVGAAVIAAIVLTVIFTAGAGEDNRVGSKTDDGGALVCPDTYKLRTNSFWVPLEPSGVDGEASLVPDIRPGHVTVCRYRAAPTTSGTADVALDGSRQLTAGVPTFTTTLAKAGKAKAGTKGGRVAGGGDIFLLGATYATGYVWIAAPVDVASNGQFVTSADVHAAAEEAFTTGAWPKA